MTKLEILNGGEMCFYKAFRKSAKDREGIELFLQRIKSKKIKSISVLHCHLPFIPLATQRELNIEVLVDFPYGLSSDGHKAEVVEDLMTLCESNRLPRPSIGWVVNSYYTSENMVNAGSYEKLAYIYNRYFDDNPRGLRIVVDPSMHTKEAMNLMVHTYSMLFDKGVMLSLCPLGGPKEPAITDLKSQGRFWIDQWHAKITKSIKTDKAFELYTKDFNTIGTPYLDRVLDGY